MRLHLENIGKIKTADVEIGGLTVIAGENDTGKSTIGKVLFSLIKANQKNILFLNDKQFNIDKVAIDIAKNFKIYLKSEFKDTLISKNSKNGEAKINLTYNTDDINYTIRDIKLNLLDDVVDIQILNNAEHIYNDKLPYTDTTLIDDISALNLAGILKNCMTIIDNNLENEIIKSTYNTTFIQYHLKDLAGKLILASKKENKTDFQEWQKNITEKIKEIMQGRWVYDDFSGNEFKFISNNHSNQSFTNFNIATGIKAFAIIELLLESGNGIISPTRPLIIDEPEIHLHPEWQLKYAEVIVELVKNDIPVIITSHSPYFIQALLHYGKKSNIDDDKLNFYLAENDEIKKDDGCEKIFEKLYKPLEDIIE
ncbi:MAG: AAA family ATPase [Rickettsiales bacterium]|nr:MAG: AAA family ATPase [Rickettsiales bacterium]